MVRHFTPEQLIKKSNILATGNDEYVGPAMELLSSEEGFEWRITVNADTLAQADYAMEKQDRIDMMTTMGKFMNGMIPMLQQAPKSAPLMLNLMKWAIAGFKNADAIEGMLDKELTMLEQESQQPPAPPPPSPEEVKAKAEQQKMQMEMQQDQQKNAMEMQQTQMEMKLEQQRLQMELAAEQQRLAMEAQKQQMELKFEMVMNQLKLMAAQQQAEIKLETANAAAETKLQTEAQSAAIARTAPKPGAK
jgi:type IV secretory pathway VirB10-like protein